MLDWLEEERLRRLEMQMADIELRFARQCRQTKHQASVFKDCIHIGGSCFPSCDKETDSLRGELAALKQEGSMMNHKINNIKKQFEDAWKGVDEIDECDTCKDPSEVKVMLESGDSFCRHCGRQLTND